MEEEQEDEAFFYLFEREQPTGNLIRENSIIEMEGEMHQKQKSPEPILIQTYQQKSQQIKAANTQYFKEYEGEKMKKFMQFQQNHKKLGGIQHFFQLNQNSSEFLEDIDSSAFNSSFADMNLKQFFDNSLQSSQFAEHHHDLQELERKCSEIYQKAIGSSSLHRSISQQYYEHFQNFAVVFNPSSFCQQLEVSLGKLITHCQKIKGPGNELILKLFQFWIKVFMDFVNEVWKCSSKYTLSFLKKEKKNQLSSKSSQRSFKEARKNWTQEEIKVLERIVDSNVIFSQSRLKELAQSLNRSTASISSKMQKIIKSKKGQFYQDDSLLKKSVQILKMHPEGLTKETITDFMNQFYEMGSNGQWEKSVGIILSSNKLFRKIKGKYKLKNAHLYQHSSGNTFKEKVVNCFLRCQQAEADLQTLVNAYLILYEGDASEERSKVIESNILKTLSRYEIFDCSQSKTVYQLIDRDNTQVTDFQSLLAF